MGSVSVRPCSPFSYSFLVLGRQRAQEHAQSISCLVPGKGNHTRSAAPLASSARRSERRRHVCRTALHLRQIDSTEGTSNLTIEYPD